MVETTQVFRAQGQDAWQAALPLLGGFGKLQAWVEWEQRQVLWVVFGFQQPFDGLDLLMAQGTRLADAFAFVLGGMWFHFFSFSRLAFQIILSAAATPVRQLLATSTNIIVILMSLIPNDPWRVKHMITRSKLWPLLAVSVVIVATQGCGKDSLLKENTGTMENLGVLPGATPPFSAANGVDSTGNLVVGRSNSADGIRAFGWNRSTGMRNLGVPAGWFGSRANAVSSNGRVVVGRASRANRFRAWRIVGQDTMETLEVLPLETNDNPYSTANSVNDNGTFTVGESGTTTEGGTIQIRHAVRWDGTSIEDLGFLPGGTQSAAMDVNGNGDVVVGWSNSRDGRRAFRWTASGGMQNLGSLGGRYSEATGVNGNGDVVVGASSSGDGQRAFRWTASGGMQNLGILPGGAQSVAMSVNDDGDVVVGWSGSRDGQRAFRWTASGGMQNLGSLDGGNSMAMDVNGNGDVVVGQSEIDPNDPISTRAFRWTASGGMQEFGILDGGTTIR